MNKPEFRLSALRITAVKCWLDSTDAECSNICHPRVYGNLFWISILEALTDIYHMPDVTRGSNSPKILFWVGGFNYWLYTGIGELWHLWTARNDRCFPTCFSHKIAPVWVISTYHLFFNLLITSLKSAKFLLLKYLLWLYSQQQDPSNHGFSELLTLFF